MSIRHLSEDTRYKLYRMGAHAAWWGAFTWLCALTWFNASHPPGTTTFQRVSGVGIVFLIGVAIALGNALSRMRLSSSIKEVFEVGMKLADRRYAAIEESLHASEAHRAEVKDTLGDTLAATETHRTEVRDALAEAEEQRQEERVEDREYDDAAGTERHNVAHPTNSATGFMVTPNKDLEGPA